MRDAKVNENRPMPELRHPGMQMGDSADSIRRAGGEDPRRYDAKIVIDRKVMDHSQSGYNHNATSSQPANNGKENIMQMNRMDKKVEGMGYPNPDGTRR
jgi:hypothetical protein